MSEPPAQQDVQIVPVRFAWQFAGAVRFAWQFAGAVRFAWQFAAGPP